MRILLNSILVLALVLLSGIQAKAQFILSGNNYATIGEAIANVADADDVIEWDGSVSFSDINSGQTFTIDLGGNTLNSNLIFSGGGTFTITNGTVVGQGPRDKDNKFCSFVEGSTLILENVTFSYTDKSKPAGTLYVDGSSNIYLNEGFHLLNNMVVDMVGYSSLWVDSGAEIYINDFSDFYNWHSMQMGWNPSFHFPADVIIKYNGAILSETQYSEKLNYSNLNPGNVNILHRKFLLGGISNLEIEAGYGADWYTYIVADNDKVYTFYDQQGNEMSSGIAGKFYCDESLNDDVLLSLGKNTKTMNLKFVPDDPLDCQVAEFKDVEVTVNVTKIEDEIHVSDSEYEILYSSDYMYPRYLSYRLGNYDKGLLKWKVTKNDDNAMEFEEDSYGELICTPKKTGRAEVTFSLNEKYSDVATVIGEKNVVVSFLVTEGFIILNTRLDGTIIPVEKAAEKGILYAQDFMFNGTAPHDQNGKQYLSDFNYNKSQDRTMPCLYYGEQWDVPQGKYTMTYPSGIKFDLIVDLSAPTNRDLLLAGDKKVESNWPDQIKDILSVGSIYITTEDSIYLDYYDPEVDGVPGSGLDSLFYEIVDDIEDIWDVDYNPNSLNDFRIIQEKTENGYVHCKKLGHKTIVTRATDKVWNSTMIDEFFSEDNTAKFTSEGFEKWKANNPNAWKDFVVLAEPVIECEKEIDVFGERKDFSLDFCLQDLLNLEETDGKSPLVALCNFVNSQGTEMNDVMVNGSFSYANSEDAGWKIDFETTEKEVEFLFTTDYDDNDNISNFDGWVLPFKKQKVLLKFKYHKIDDVVVSNLSDPSQTSSKDYPVVLCSSDDQIQITFSIADGNSVSSYYILDGKNRKVKDGNLRGNSPYSIIMSGSDLLLTDGDVKRFRLIAVNEGTPTTAQAFDISMGLPPDRIVRLYDDILMVDNKDSILREFHWLLNGQKINDKFADRQAYKIPAAQLQQYRTDKYSLDVVKSDGSVTKVCPAEIVPVSKSLRKYVAVYPNPAKAYEELSLRLVNFMDDELADAELIIYNSLGNVVQRIKNPDESIQIALPSGIYSGSVICEGRNVSFKFIVQ